MSRTTDIWIAFLETFSMLFLVLALLILVFYLIRKFSAAKGIKGSRDFIKILSVHHMSPKEKLVLVEVLNEVLLVGVTPNQISKISSYPADKELSQKIKQSTSSTPLKFQDFFLKKMGKNIKDQGGSVLKAGER